MFVEVAESPTKHKLSMKRLNVNGLRTGVRFPAPPPNNLTDNTPRKGRIVNPINHEIKQEARKREFTWVALAEISEC